MAERNALDWTDFCSRSSTRGLNAEMRAWLEQDQAPRPRFANFGRHARPGTGLCSLTSPSGRDRATTSRRCLRGTAERDWALGHHLRLDQDAAPLHHRVAAEVDEARVQPGGENDISMSRGWLDRPREIQLSTQQPARATRFQQCINTKT